MRLYVLDISCQLDEIVCPCQLDEIAYPCQLDGIYVLVK